MEQIFGFTADTNPNGATPYVQLFRLDDGRHELRVRGEDGQEGRIVLADTKRLALGMKLTGEFLIVSGQPGGIEPS